MHKHFSLVMADNKHKSPLNQFCNLAVLAMHSKRQVNVTLLLYHVCVMNFDDIKNQKRACLSSRYLSRLYLTTY